MPPAPHNALDPRHALALFKASLELQFRLCDLMRRNALRWNEAQNRMIDGCASKFEAAAASLLDAPDWRQVGFVATDLGWKALQQRNCALLEMATAVVANQSALQQDLQQAWAQWQHDCTRALKEASGAMPLSTTLENLLATATRPPMLPDGKG